MSQKKYHGGIPPHPTIPIGTGEPTHSVYQFIVRPLLETNIEAITPDYVEGLFTGATKDADDRPMLKRALHDTIKAALDTGYDDQVEKCKEVAEAYQHASQDDNRKHVLLLPKKGKHLLALDLDDKIMEAHKPWNPLATEELAKQRDKVTKTHDDFALGILQTPLSEGKKKAKLETFIKAVADHSVNEDYMQVLFNHRKHDCCGETYLELLAVLDYLNPDAVSTDAQGTTHGGVDVDGSGFLVNTSRYKPAIRRVVETYQGHQLLRANQLIDFNSTDDDIMGKTGLNRRAVTLLKHMWNDYNNDHPGDELDENIRGIHLLNLDDDYKQAFFDALFEQTRAEGLDPAAETRVQFMYTLLSEMHKLRIASDYCIDREALFTLSDDERKSVRSQLVGGLYAPELFNAAITQETEHQARVDALMQTYEAMIQNMI